MSRLGDSAALRCAAGCALPLLDAVFRAGGLFIGEFVAKDTSWAHLDIGGTSTATKDSGHKVEGGTGFGTLTLIKLAEML